MGGMEVRGWNSVRKQLLMQLLIPPLLPCIPSDSRGFSLGSSHGGHQGRWILAPAISRGKFQGYCRFDPIFSVGPG